MEERRRIERGGRERMEGRNRMVTETGGKSEEEKREVQKA